MLKKKKFGTHSKNVVRKPLQRETGLCVRLHPLSHLHVSTEEEALNRGPKDWGADTFPLRIFLLDIFNRVCQAWTPH